MQKIRGFTLVEVIITIVIMGLLIGLLFEVFVTIGRISVFVQLNRSLHSELIYTAQTLQNMIDDQRMDLAGLEISGSGGDSLTYGWKQSLQLADNEFNYEISRQCEEGQNCYLQLYRIEKDPDILGGGTITGSVAITDAGLIDVASFNVRTLPYGSSYEDLLHRGFWVFIDMRVPQYDESVRRFNVHQKAQFFFTMRKYE